MIMKLQHVFDLRISLSARRSKVSFLRSRGGGTAARFLNRETREESGVSLLEVVIAMAVLSIAVIGLAGGLSFVISVSNALEEQAATETLAARYVEEYLSGRCPTEDTSASAYRIGSNTDEGKYIVRVSSDDEELFALSSLAVGQPNCPEGEDE